MTLKEIRKNWTNWQKGYRGSAALGRKTARGVLNGWTGLSNH